jgi:hypothetical protein
VAADEPAASGNEDAHAPDRSRPLVGVHAPPDGRQRGRRNAPSFRAPEKRAGSVREVTG